MGKAGEEARDQETQRDCNLGPPSTRPIPPTSQKTGTPRSRKAADTLNTELCPHVITDLCLHAYLVLLPPPTPTEFKPGFSPTGSPAPGSGVGRKGGRSSLSEPRFGFLIT